LLTGETGAGKSILVDALALVLGGRAGPEMLRAGAERASVEAEFDLSSNRAARVMPGGLPAWQARRVSAHVEGNISARIHIPQLARLVGLSASHFCRAFKCSFGVSPRAYVLRRRIEVAQALMLTTPAPLSAIAVSCGMCDQQHFTRSFRRIVGETPSTWRRARQGVLQIK